MKKIVVISDVHANYAALKAIGSYIDLLRNDGDVNVVFLGDMAGYGPAVDLPLCIAWAKSQPNFCWISGNHDAWLLNSTGGGMSREAAFSLIGQRHVMQQEENAGLWDWFSKVVGEQLSIESTNANMDGFFSNVCFTVGAVRFLGVHAAFEKMLTRNQYLLAWEPTAIERQMRMAEAHYSQEKLCLLNGHTHFPLYAEYDKQALKVKSIKYGKPETIDRIASVNPGSLGQPRDGDRRAAFVVIDGESGSVAFHRLDYDYAETISKLERERSLTYLRSPFSLAQKKSIQEQIQSMNGLAGPALIRQAWEEAYQSNIDRLGSAHGGSRYVEYCKIYQPSQWDLIAVKRSENVRG